MRNKEQDAIDGQVELRTPSWREFLFFFLVRGFLCVGESGTQIKRMYQQLVERRRWLSRNDFEEILNFCGLFPGPQALKLAIHVGQLKRKLLGGVVAGILFLLPGIALIVLLASLYATYARTPKVTAFMFILRPAVLGIVTAGAIKLAAEKIHNYLLATIVVASFAASYWEADLLPVLVAAGSVNLLVSFGLPQLHRKSTQLPVQGILALVLLNLLIHPHWLRVSWLFLKSGLFSVGGPYATFAFLHQGAVEGYRWVSVGQLLDGLTLSIALPGSLALFSTFVGFFAGGTSGAILGTFFVFAPSFVLVLSGRYYRLHYTNVIRSFLAGASAAIVGAVIFIIIDIAPVAFVGPATVAVAISTFLAIALINLDMTLVAALSIAGAILYAVGPIGQIALPGPIQ